MHVNYMNIIFEKQLAQAAPVVYGFHVVPILYTSSVINNVFKYPL